MVSGMILTGLLYNLDRKLHRLEGTNKEYMIPIPYIRLLKKENIKTRTRMKYSFPFDALYSSHSQLLPYDSE